MVRFREVLFTRNFFTLWSGQIISEFGDRLYQMALIALVYQKSPGSAMAMAKLFFFIVMPVFVIGPVAGVYVDRWDRKKVMVISDIFRGFLVLFIPFFVYLNLMTPIYVLVFLVFAGQRFFLPSKLALIPAIVQRDDLLVANTLSNTTRMIAAMMGFAAAGFIVSLIGHMWAFYLNAISYFVSAVLVSLISVPKQKWHKVSEEITKTGAMLSRSIRKNVWHEILEGFKYMIKKDSMKVVTGTLFLLMAGSGAVFCIIIVFIQETFGSITQDLGFFGVFLGAGLFAGTIVYGKYGQNRASISTVFACFALSGVSLGAFALYSGRRPEFLGGALIILVTGAVVAPILTINHTLIHKLIPDQVRGRIFSSMEAVMHLAFLGFMFFTAVLSRRFSNLSILLSSGIGFFVTGVAGFVLAKRKEN